MDLLTGLLGSPAPPSVLGFVHLGHVPLAVVVPPEPPEVIGGGDALPFPRKIRAGIRCKFGDEVCEEDALAIMMALLGMRR